jgi:methionyl-tRNA formyltransferase
MILKIEIVSDADSWLIKYLARLVEKWRSDGHSVSLAGEVQCANVDVRFFLSYSKIAKAEQLAKATTNIVVHGSDLPRGRGWSPWTWQILEDANLLPLTLFEAIQGVDAGPIYDQRWVQLQGHELIAEWQEAQALATISMCEDFIRSFPEVLSSSRPQVGFESSYPRRRPKDSGLSLEKSLAAQFNLLRVVDNEKYPAFFEYKGHTYELTIKKRMKGNHNK